MATRKNAKSRTAKKARTPALTPGTRRPPTRKAVGKAKARARRAIKRKPLPIPKGYHTLTPYLVVKDAAAALEVYARALGAKEKLRLAMPNGAVMHAEMKFGDSMLMLTEENPAWGAKSPLTLGGSATHVMIYVRDVDAAFARALANGCTAEMPVTNMFWGDRYGKLRDPFGHVWSIATHVEDVGPKETQRRADIEMAKMAATG